VPNLQQLIMLGIRGRALSAAKRSVRAASYWPFVGKVLKLVSQERDVARSERAYANHHKVLVDRVGLTVRRGPFAGMTYASAHSTGSAIVPKLLGSYECELHGVLAEIARREPPYSMVLDIGAAEGYYAVGVARMLPETRVIAYEIEEDGRTLLAANARVNGVSDRIAIHGACTPEALASVSAEVAASARVLIITDCEGAEYGLLDHVRQPAVASMMRRADVLMELHRDSRQPGGTAPRDFWGDRLSATHDLTWIDVAGRDPAQYPELTAIPYDQRQPVLFERTDDTGWLFARARDSN
jgi:hypothetical protein